MNFNALLKLMVVRKASDLFISAGIPPSMKIEGKIQPVANKRLTSEQAQEMIFALMTPRQRATFIQDSEVNFALAEEKIGRFRANVYRHQTQVGMVLRRIKTEIPKCDELALPPVYQDLAMMRQGLVLLVGGTGVGKSSSLAAMVNHRNQHSSGHIICLEDPIEFIHQPINSIVTQREIGVDTIDYQTALKNTLRQSPDLIVVGEIRDEATLRQTLQYAETGHLCLATLHATNATQALERILSLCPNENLNKLLMDLSLSLKAILGQRLIPTLDGKRKLATEVLLNTPLIASTIRKNNVHLVRELMEKSNHPAMSTFDQALYEMFVDDQISYEEALQNADASNEVRLKIKLHQNGDPNYVSETLENVTFIEH